LKHNIKPKKSLGQNFLVDDNISRKIISVLDCRENDTVLEIGPGTGALTRFLAAQPVNLVAVEIDKRAVEELTAKFPAHDYKNLRIVNSDFLTFPIQSVVNDNKKIKVIGNIPYYIWLIYSSGCLNLLHLLKRQY
jgi:16S rRNA (adenine1518-N6/adenine1519-N6)-dimethyltransferase